ncbi:beta-ketoacyl-[acyl-carrier-protein] synthase family protein [Janthinobacterium fluminis]|uniref:Beta-ketoacyl synthase N-terminal-like domain-containing protein n=1 Tax=Janthinobacterium fluminis TaxID=2987524 RepID=A0ABT5K2J1_9BURK|nr:beta-ketoacyl synthase N-terminal-like domain-containing protein [Janthinobacterium fluminis]MDC8758946.1 beta-ketoacyl synthase N-terminal-like domain-containing protein [Janthinobacterium fluminis]
MRLAITGSAMVTSVGPDKQTGFDAMCRGVSGRTTLQGFPAQRFNAKYAYEIADRPAQADGSTADATLRASAWLRDAIVAAVREAKLGPDEDLCVIVGTGLRELRSLELFWTEGQEFSLPALHFEAAVEQALGFAVPVMTVCNACSASNYALAMAEDLIANGRYQCVVVAGCDAITESMFGLLDRVNPEPPEMVQPFERARKGVLMGEGAAALVLENPGNVARRGARVQAWSRGVGTSCDANHETAPDMAGIARAIADAHQRARLQPRDIDLIVVHGTGTHLNDATEANALRHVFGAAISSVPISGLKSMTGHTSGSSGLVGVVTAIASLRAQTIAPTLNFSSPMAEAEGMLIVHDRALQHAMTYVQVNAFGFGGVNAVAIIEKVAA